MRKFKYLEEKKFSENALGKLTIDGDVLHYILGIVEEYQELRKSVVKDGVEKDAGNVNKISELGDLYWFISSLLIHLEDEFDPEIDPNHTVPNLWYDLDKIEEEVFSIVRYLKKYVAYDAEFRTVEITQSCKRILAYMSDICKCLDVTVHEVLEKNLAKLRLRFGDSFDKEKALNKDEVKELSYIKRIKVKQYYAGRPSLKKVAELKALPEDEEPPVKAKYVRKKKRRRKRGRKRGPTLKKLLPKRRRGRPTYREQNERTKLERKIKARLAKRKERLKNAKKENEKSIEPRDSGDNTKREDQTDIN
jgi:hypothetical protein